MRNKDGLPGQARRDDLVLRSLTFGATAKKLRVTAGHKAGNDEVV
jgi:hypothetical protein